LIFKTEYAILSIAINYIKEITQMAKKNGYIELVDDLPWIVKIILCLPALDFVWAIYRIVKGATTQNMVLLIIGIVWLIGAISIGWIIDLVSVILWKHPILA